VLELKRQTAEKLVRLSVLAAVRGGWCEDLQGIVSVPLLQVMQDGGTALRSEAGDAERDAECEEEGKEDAHRELSFD
jgi:hypothetical protein